jgi:mono/diheme cytochrome c family protein
MTPLRIAAVAASILMLNALTACRKDVVVDPAWAAVPLPVETGWIPNHAMADAGAELFAANCSACHYIGGEDVDAGLGPNLQGVTRRRDATWIRAMIANPDSMLATDSIAGRLYDEYGIRMLNVGAGEAEVRALVEFLWRADHGAADGA